MKKLYILPLFILFLSLNKVENVNATLLPNSFALETIRFDGNNTPSGNNNTENTSATTNNSPNNSNQNNNNNSSKNNSTNTSAIKTNTSNNQNQQKEEKTKKSGNNDTKKVNLSSNELKGLVGGAVGGAVAGGTLAGVLTKQKETKAAEANKSAYESSMSCYLGGTLLTLDDNRGFALPNISERFINLKFEYKELENKLNSLK